MRAKNKQLRRRELRVDALLSALLAWSNMTTDTAKAAVERARPMKDAKQQRKLPNLVTTCGKKKLTNI
jgi:hypothetical protein